MNMERWIMSNSCSGLVFTIVVTRFVTGYLRAAAHSLFRFISSHMMSSSEPRSYKPQENSNSYDDETFGKI